MKIGNRIKNIALDGIVRQNPSLKLVLGTCPALALTTAMLSGLYMGLAVTFVLVCSNVLISLLRNIIPDKVRIPCFIVIIATFVTVLDMGLYAYADNVYDILGTFLPLIVVNCLILGRAEGFASANGVGYSALDGVFMGLGFTLSLTLMGAVREILGSGSIAGVKLWDFQIAFFSQSAGAFLTYGILVALFTFFYNLVEKKSKQKSSKSTKEAQV